MTGVLDELRWRTPSRWAVEVLADPEALLADHAHLENAAAANALSLVRRWPEGTAPDRWVARLASIAREEVDHLALVSRTLVDRGGRLHRQHRNPYAAALRSRVATGDGELADRLYVSALIELRSFERFSLLADAGHQLSGLYGGLQASEQGHHRVFVQLGELAGGTAERWEWWCEQEADVARSQAPGPRIHAGPA